MNKQVRSSRKPRARRRLTLRRETLRSLSQDDLAAVVGGSDDGDDSEGCAVVLDNGCC